MGKAELIDDYLTNRLDKQDRENFELDMKSDLALKSEVDLQLQTIEAIRKARMTELKAMLNKVPVSGGASFHFSALRLAASIVGTAVLVSALYYYFSPNNDVELSSLSTSIEDSIAQPVEPSKDENPQPDSKARVEKEKAVVRETEKTPVTKEAKTPPVEVNKPALDVVDPTADLAQGTATHDVIENSKPVVAFSKMEVEVDSSSKKYSFHYQFVNNKLILFGTFERSLYELLDINGDSHSLFLVYKENYYLLDETKDEITPLEMIHDKTLIQKLKEYRKAR